MDATISGDADRDGSATLSPLAASSSSISIALRITKTRLNAIITLNPRALDEADVLDRERAQGTLRGPLHGIPVALENNVNTRDMPTTGGAVALTGFEPPYEATLTRNCARLARSSSPRPHDRVRQLVLSGDARQLQRPRRTTA